MAGSVLDTKRNAKTKPPSPVPPTIFMKNGSSRRSEYRVSNIVQGIAAKPCSKKSVKPSGRSCRNPEDILDPYFETREGRLLVGCVDYPMTLDVGGHACRHRAEESVDFTLFTCDNDFHLP